METNDQGRRTASMPERLAFMRLDEARRAALGEAWRVVEPRLGELLETFYRHLRATPQMAAMLEAHATGGVERLKAAQREH